MNQRLQVFLPFLKCIMLLLSLLLMLVASTSDKQPEPLSYQPPVDEERIAEVVKKAQKGEARFEGRVEEQELVRLALMRVAPKPRSCLLLHVEGFSQDEIAKLLGLSRKSVGTYVSIAREQFRQAYHRLENA